MLKTLRTLAFACTSVLALLFAVPAQANWYSWTLSSTGTNLGSLTLNYLGDLTWNLPSGSQSVASTLCTASQGAFVVRHDYGGQQFFAMLQAAQMKAIAVGRSIVVKTYVDETSVSTACDGGTNQGYPSFVSLEIDD